MEQQKKKRRKHTFRAAVIVAIGVFVAGWVLTTGVEWYLRKELVKRTEEATDGFYRLSFDDLSVRLLKGELRLKGIRLVPDSLLFARWKATDSLPDTYLSAHIREMGFSGLNLAWVWNYKHLDFFSFSILEPDIQIYNSNNSDNREKKPRHVKSKSLYESISPYIDVLSVRKIKLDHARISYTVENPVSPIVYKLEDASFHGYGFLLDSLSALRGNLLDMDRFDFETYRPQCLLINNDFLVKTDSVRLSTEDSLIYIGNLQLVPQEQLWEESKRRPDRYLAATVPFVQVRGAAFKRREGLNYLTAGSFDITDTEIRALNIFLPPSPDTVTVSSKGAASSEASSFDAARPRSVDRITGDSLVRALSLYEVISPLLHRIAIAKVNIGNARMDYAQQVDDATETYRLDAFDFKGDDFLIDSLSVEKYELGYFRNIALEANGIQADMTARNHNLEVGRLALNTEKGYLRVEGIRLKPRTTRTRNDYLSGTIDTIRVDGLHYDRGVSADLFRISAPHIRYVKAPSYSRKKGKTTGFSDNRVDVEGLLNPLFRYLTIGRIEIDEGVASFMDRTAGSRTLYRLNRFNFFATDFRLDEETGKGDGLFFTSKDMGFSFAGFDNELPGEAYRLAIRKGRLSTVDGIFRLHDVKLSPQKSLRLRDTVTYVSLSTPLVDIRGIRFPDHRLSRSFRTAGLRVDSPAFSLGKKDSIFFRTDLEKIEMKDFSYDPQLVAVGTLDFVHPSVNLHSYTAIRRDSLPVDSLQTDFRPVDSLRIVSLLADLLSEDSLRIASRLRDSLQESVGKADTAGRADAKQAFGSAESSKPSKSGLSDLYRSLGSIARQWQIKQVNVRQGEVGYSWQFENAFVSETGKSTVDLSVDELSIDTEKQQFGMGAVRFEGDDLEFPLDDGFYALKVGRVRLNDSDLRIDSIHLVSPYPKMEFAYFQPHHKDWFDVRVDHLAMTGLDLPFYLSDQVLKAEELRIRGVLLQNFKNKKIVITPHIVPMIYTVIQKAPLRFSVADAHIEDFFVIYEELSKKGTRPGKLVFTDMNGHVSGFTNIPRYREQYIRIDATGKMMDNGFFTASWLWPVDSLNDRFLLEAKMERFDFSTLNQIITPLASAEVKSGYAHQLHFSMDAGSQGGTIDMALPYRDLKVALLKKKDGKLTDKAFLSRIANWVLKHDNPSHPERPDSKLRKIHRYVERDPYHSSFNYLWQLLKPALIETVGITKTEQDIAKGVVGFFAKVKKFFGFGKKKKEITPPPPESFILIEEVENEEWVEGELETPAMMR